MRVYMYVYMERTVANDFLKLRRGYADATYFENIILIIDETYTVASPLEGWTLATKHKDWSI